MEKNSNQGLNWVYAALTVMIIALLYLSAYSQPINDDYCFAYYVSEVDSLSANVSKDWGKLNGRWGTSAMRYFFMTIIGLDSLYWLTIPLSLIALFSASLLIANIIVPPKTEDNYNSGYNKEKFGLACINSLIFLSICSSLSDVVFWGTGLTDYTLGYLLVSLCLFSALKTINTEQKPSAITYITLLISTILSCSIAELFSIPVWAFLIFCFVLGKKRTLLTPVLLVMIVATGLNILAPGNTVRSGNVTESLALMEFIKENLLYGLRGLILPCIGMYLISYLPGIKPFLLRLSDNISDTTSLKVRWLTCLFIIGFPLLIITILLISLGAPGPGRAHNVSLFAIISAWPIFISVFTFLKPKQFKFIAANITLAILGVLVLIAQNNKDISKDILTGKAKNFDNEMIEVRNFLNQTENIKQAISLNAQTRPPFTSSALGYLVSNDKNYWINQCVSLYYGLESIDAKQKQ